MFRQLMAGLAAAMVAGGAQAGAPGVVSAIHVSVGPKLEAKARIYGDGDLAFLQNELEGDVQSSLEDAGLTGPGGANLELTIIDATASHPTFREMADRPDLSVTSPRLGGATIEAAIRYPDGRTKTLAFRWYESDFKDQAMASTIWSDAQAAFRSFARRLVRGELSRH
jgi:hypothetical protein